MTYDRQALLAGAFFVLVGIAFGTSSVLQGRLGTPVNMGPGFFPLVLSGVLALLGTAIALNGVRSTGAVVRPVPWRGLLTILAAPVIFGLTVRGFGLVGSLICASVVASCAATRIDPLRVIVTSVALTAFCVAIFKFGLGQPIALIGPWLGG